MKYPFLKPISRDVFVAVAGEWGAEPTYVKSADLSPLYNDSRLREVGLSVDLTSRTKREEGEGTEEYTLRM